MCGEERHITTGPHQLMRVLQSLWANLPHGNFLFLFPFIVTNTGSWDGGVDRFTVAVSILCAECKSRNC